jgi:hypothetical protein
LSTDCRGVGGTRRETRPRISLENPGEQQAEAIDKEQNRTDQSAAATFAAYEANGACHQKQGSHDEISDLYPTEVPIDEYAEWVASNIEAGPKQNLKPANEQVYPSSCNA